MKTIMGRLIGKVLQSLLLGAFLLPLGLLGTNSLAEDSSRASQPPTTLITNVSIFDGTSAKLIKGKDVVVKGDIIDAIVDAGVDTSGYDAVIDGKGDYLTPGLIVNRVSPASMDADAS